MRTEAFDYHLPEELVASRPPAQRDAGRMCVVQRSGTEHALVKELPHWIRSGDLIVLNETKVRRARLPCRRQSTDGASGGKVELLFLECLDGGESQTTDRSAGEAWLAMGRANKPLRAGDRLKAPGAEFVILERREQGLLVVKTDSDVEQILRKHGQMPIPPYMRRGADDRDLERYQTVFARQMGSAAAPTAGLHLTPEAIASIRERGAGIGRLVLHVGIGTFRPVAVDDLDQHPMHSEKVLVGEELRRQIEETRAREGRVIAIGTTAVRALEAARDPARSGYVQSTRGETDLLIQPGYRFSVVDALLTNFHMPKSTLIALVSAFAGHERTMNAYAEAVNRKYRFLSYGDAMWIPECLTRGDS